RRTAPRLATLRRGAASAGGRAVLSPMHGLIVELRAVAGDRVNEGDVVAVIEAMKMMNEIRAHKDGVVATIHVTPGATIEAGSALMTLS
ncbi:MAG: acetyl-CoA carboxylase biotin carboxyl carrier protein subunit, partial [Candidatus Cybelea sp.]